MSLKEVFRTDPPEQHWRNPYPDDRGGTFCGHCGDDWPCAGAHIDARREPLPEFFIVARASAGSPQIASLSAARAEAVEGSAGSVILAVYADGTVTAVEARKRDERGLLVCAVYDTIFELATTP